ncbi:MAG: hypothetical protein HY907_12215 [Deltaproteobacteria bacterium]|nr:hypothetical protein [Deltaproteobacteria bacterium]
MLAVLSPAVRARPVSTPPQAAFRRLLVASLAVLAGCDGTPGADAADGTPIDVTSAEGDGTDGGDVDDAEDVHVPFDSGTVSISGNAFRFGPPGGFVAGAEITVLEHSGLLAVTDDDGAFRIDGVPAWRDATLILNHPDHPPIQTGTFGTVVEPLDQVTFQAPTREVFEFMASLVGVTPDPARCQIGSTVTRVGGSLYGPGGSHGETGATVTIEPAVPAEQGPIYFNLVSADVIFPDPALTETTEDGGVLFVNVEPGEYVLAAHKAGMTFTPARVLCRAGFLVNASPPWALQGQ